MSQELLTLVGFLDKYKNGTSISHTKIPDVTNGRYGAKYSIPDDKLDQFYKLYFKSVFKQNNIMHLTEVQRKPEGVFLVDIDERYDTSVEERQHTSDHIIDLIEMYAENIKNATKWPQGESIQVFVFEKNNVNHCEEYTKDGIHLVFNLTMHHSAQVIIREKILQNIGDIFEDLPLVNDYESLIDRGIARGSTNWQLYGSSKPGNEAYKITKILSIILNEDNEFEFEDSPITNKTHSIDFLKKCSARNLDTQKFEFN